MTALEANLRIGFFLIGAAKSGTTTLYDSLAPCDGIWLPQVKENTIFARDALYAEHHRHLQILYAQAPPGRIHGGAYAHAMHMPEVVERLHRHNPRMKLLAVLRNPIERAYSAYWFARRNTWERLEFEQALAADARRLEGSYIERAELTHLSQGYYAQHLRRVFQRFSRDQVLVLATERLADSPAEVLAEVLEFLGLDGRTAPPMLGASNVAGLPRLPWLQRFFNAENAWYQRLARRCLPLGLRALIQRTVAEPLVNRWNLRRFHYPPMEPRIRAFLAEHYRPHNAELSRLLGWDLSHWD